MYKKILQIQSLNLPIEITKIIFLDYKYSMLETKYKRDYSLMITMLNHYVFLNKKVNKKEHKDYSLLDTIKYFD
tara:strand:- start:1371 stop:1592 length:222 start_codon:yes stop_codon:yes gene_type:complete